MKKHINKILITVFIFLLVAISLLNNDYISNKFSMNNTIKSFGNGQEKTTEKDSIYLSDITPFQYKVGYGNLLFDKTADNKKISMYVNGSLVQFDKGIWAHATSFITYDLTEYADYPILSVYYGVNSSSGNNGNGVVFYIQMTNDDPTNTKNWTNTAVNQIILKSGDGARKVQIDTTGYKYVRLFASDNGANGNDHSVWAEAKLVKRTYRELPDEIMTTDEYDAEITKLYNTSQSTDNEQLQKLIFQRDLVNQIGEYQLKKILNNQSILETYRWLISDVERLKLFVMGGKPEGTWLKI